MSLSQQKALFKCREPSSLNCDRFVRLDQGGEGKQRAGRGRDGVNLSSQKHAREPAVQEGGGGRLRAKRRHLRSRTQTQMYKTNSEQKHPTQTHSRSSQLALSWTDTLSGWFFLSSRPPPIKSR